MERDDKISYYLDIAEAIVERGTCLRRNFRAIIVKNDDGKYAMYAHLTSIYVYNGQRVDKGVVIGGAGATGRATGVHLHFSIWTGYPYYGGTALNPYNFY